MQYSGWPKSSELSINAMTQQHNDALISKCSRKKDVPMPHFAVSPSLVSHTMTPLRNYTHVVRDVGRYTTEDVSRKNLSALHIGTI
jgi:hypothetical protein